jgi:hypothetical protein
LARSDILFFGRAQGKLRRISEKRSEMSFAGFLSGVFRSLAWAERLRFIDSFHENGYLVLTLPH